MKRLNQIAVIFCLIFGIVSCGSDQKPEDEKSDSRIAPLQQLDKIQLQNAVTMVQINLRNMQDGGGYQSWTPTKAVDKLVPLLNSAVSALPQNSDNPTTAAKVITYVKNKVVHAWQVVLIPLDDDSLILIKAYGKDTINPLIEQKIKVNKY